MKEIKQSGLSLEELAFALDVSVWTLRAWIDGKRQPKNEAQHIARLQEYISAKKALMEYAENESTSSAKLLRKIWK